MLSFHRIFFTYSVLIVCILVAVSLSMEYGSSQTSFFYWLTGEVTTPQASTILFELRFPRILAACLIGALLGYAGCLLQGLFQNPLADPGLLGIASGAAVGAACAIVLLKQLNLPSWLAHLSISGAAFLGCLTITILLVLLARQQKSLNMTLVLLAGIALNAICGCLLGFISYFSSDTQLRQIIFWQLGNLDIYDWSKLALLILSLMLSLALLPFFVKRLNALLLGEVNSFYMGFNQTKTTWITIIICALIIGVSVSFAGVISFVGLVSPHIMRLVVGANHVHLLPMSALAGCALLVVSDLVSRQLLDQGVLPVGLMTASIGAPFFLYLLLKQRHKLWF